MPLDGFTLGAIAKELHAALCGGRVDKIIQPERDEIIFTIRNGGANHMLLTSSSVGCARAHITAQKKTSPLEPFNLCMLMRKHLIGGRISDIRQIDCDRILEIEFEHLSDLGDRTHKTLICEFMGKHSNLIFVDAEGRIIDSARRVSEAISSVREVLPGLRYERPPQHGKIPFDSVRADALCSALSGRSGSVQKLLSDRISGLSRQTAREIAYRACGNADAHISECDLQTLCAAAEAFFAPREAAPTLVYDDAGTPADVTAFPYQSYDGLRMEPVGTLSEAFDRFYRTRDQAERISQKSAAIHRALKTNIERCEKKLALQREALLGSERMEEYRIKGELLTANAHQVQKGQKCIDLPNYYDPDMRMLHVDLDVRLSGMQNAQRYFKLYQKARNARTLAAEQIERTSAELDYLEGQADNLTKCAGESELFEIRQELEKYSYMRASGNRRQIKQLPPSQPMRFTAPNGGMILVGRNNLQNDKLTFSAQPNEVWLHAKDMPGSHVIIVGAEPDSDTILYAARIAAAYSRGGASTRVPVDYTLRKYVKKPSGAKPGFVIYTNQRTLYVAPIEK